MNKRKKDILMRYKVSLKKSDEGYAVWVPGLPGISHLGAVRAFEKSGFRIARKGKHITMTDGERIITIPREDPINAYTMAGIIKDAGLGIEEFKKFIRRN